MGMNTLLENIRASAILMKNLPSTLSGDALLISREEARRIGYELEACAERMGQKVPQGVEEWIDSVQVQLADESPAGWGRYILVSDARSYLSGMAIVPVERTFEAGARAFKNLMIEASHAAIHPHIEGVYGAFEHRLAATKEKGE